MRYRDRESDSEGEIYIYRNNEAERDSERKRETGRETGLKIKTDVAR